MPLSCLQFGRSKGAAGAKRARLLQQPETHLHWNNFLQPSGRVSLCRSLCTPASSAGPHRSPVGSSLGAMLGPSMPARQSHARRTHPPGAWQLVSAHCSQPSCGWGRGHSPQAPPAQPPGPAAPSILHIPPSSCCTESTATTSEPRLWGPNRPRATPAVAPQATRQDATVRAPTRSRACRAGRCGLRPGSAGQAVRVAPCPRRLNLCSEGMVARTGPAARLPRVAPTHACLAHTIEGTAENLLAVLLAPHPQPYPHTPKQARAHAQKNTSAQTHTTLLFLCRSVSELAGRRGYLLVSRNSHADCGTKDWTMLNLNR